MFNKFISKNFKLIKITIIKIELIVKKKFNYNLEFDEEFSFINQ